MEKTDSITDSIHAAKLAKLEEIAKKHGKQIPNEKTDGQQTFFWGGASLQVSWEEYIGGRTDIRYLF